MSVRNSSFTTELSGVLFQAARELGYKITNMNGESHTGFMKPELSLNDLGQRWTSDQFLRSTGNKRKNLKILSKTVAVEILLLNGFEAYGVRIHRNGVQHTIYANLEVIVSAGAVGSPKLLMLSGIGPKNSLTDANVS